MKTDMVPEFAIVGHPNEGKSSVVSTLAEDDSVRISPVPGETIVCQTFPVVIDGREIIRFVDTPGFQTPQKTLKWMKEYLANNGLEESMLRDFIESHINNPDFRDDCELLGPIARGAGIIYVVDGSRPVRKVDISEMEILRLTGRPRMAIINCKDENTRYLEKWKSEFRKNFNSIRVFNAHKATYAERIALLESLKSIDQDWQDALETVIFAFKKDWDMRNDTAADIICTMLKDCLEYTESEIFTENTNEEAIKKKLAGKFNLAIEKIEKKAHSKIRALYKHNIFNLTLPPYSILHDDLFGEKTWQFLGLTQKQIIAAAGIGGAAAGAALDIVAHGFSLGLFAAVGGAIGAGWAALGGGKKLAKTKMVGMNLGGHKITIGPIDNIQFMYVLLDRALIFYSHVINWAHGRRDYEKSANKNKTRAVIKAGITTDWDSETRSICNNFFTAIKKGDEYKKEMAMKKLKTRLKDVLKSISGSTKKYGLVLGV